MHIIHSLTQEMKFNLLCIWIYKLFQICRDVVMACMAYHHFPDQEQFRNEAMRVLKPGGSLYISDPRFPLIVRWIFNTFFKDAGFRTTKKNRMDFERSGFKTVSITKDVYVQVVHFTKGK